MNRNDLTFNVAKKLKLPQPMVTRIVKAFLAEVRTAVAQGESVMMEDFGVVEPRRRMARTSRNLHTGGLITTPTRMYPAFKAARGFRADVKKLPVTPDE